MSFLCNDAYNNGKIVIFYNVYCKEIIIISNLPRNDDIARWQFWLVAWPSRDLSMRISIFLFLYYAHTHTHIYIYNIYIYIYIYILTF